jgi:uncharacterized protein (TIGR02646 family)
LIRITKPSEAPPKLAEGEPLVRAHEAERQTDPTAGASRTGAFKFDKTIYGATVVKRALRKAQHNKCCYCEGFFAGQASGDVEHFRPKTCFQQERGGPIEYPGYYWLAYAWSNLYYSCEICNRVGKRNLFPIADVAQRWRTGRDIGQETPQILDPGGADDPRCHIKFRGAAPEGVTDLGRSTISVLGLDRGDLITARLQHLKLLDALKDLATLPSIGLDEATLNKRRDASKKLQQIVAPDAVYSAMAQDYLTIAIDQS